MFTSQLGLEFQCFMIGIKFMLSLRLTFKLEPVTISVICN